MNPWTRDRITIARVRAGQRILETTVQCTADTRPKSDKVSIAMSPSKHRAWALLLFSTLVFILGMSIAPLVKAQESPAKEAKEAEEKETLLGEYGPLIDEFDAVQQELQAAEDNLDVITAYVWEFASGGSYNPATSVLYLEATAAANQWVLVLGDQKTGGTARLLFEVLAQHPFVDFTNQEATEHRVIAAVVHGPKQQFLPLYGKIVISEEEGQQVATLLPYGLATSRREAVTQAEQLRILLAAEPPDLRIPSCGDCVQECQREYQGSSSLCDLDLQLCRTGSDLTWGICRAGCLAFVGAPINFLLCNRACDRVRRITENNCARDHQGCINNALRNFRDCVGDCPTHEPPEP